MSDIGTRRPTSEGPAITPPAGVFADRRTQALYARSAGLLDLEEMPNWNPKTGKHALRSVSEYRVYWDDQNKVCCVDHGAMNCVNPERTIWRCLALGCQTAAYMDWDDDDARPTYDGVPSERYA